jgi:hypothetical protein
MTKMTDRELTRLALIDAHSWQHSLAVANGMDSVAGKAAVARAAQYRDQLRRKFGMKEMPEDAVQRRLAGAKALNITDLMTGRLKMTEAGVLLPKGK